MIETAVAHLRAFLAGIREFRSSFTLAYPGDDELSRSYDRGRELAHRLTFRRYEA